MRRFAVAALIDKIGWSSMFLHIVMMRLDKKIGEIFFEQVNSLVERVSSECEGLVMFHFGKNEAERADGYEYVTSAIFVDAAAHDNYQISPAHTAMKSFMSPYIKDVVVYDASIPFHYEHLGVTTR